MIVSTVPVLPVPDVPVVLINSQLSNMEISKISSTIETIKSKKLHRKMEQKLKFLFYEDLFFFNQGFTSERDAITFLAEKLEQKGCVDSQYKQKIFEREDISSSAYSNIAMPHPLEMNSKKTAIAVSIHNTPMNWKQNKVNIIFMLAIQEDDRTLFRDIFDFVTQIISNTHYLQALLTTKTYQEFIDLLLSYI